jgi:hypothetical protein
MAKRKVPQSSTVVVFKVGLSGRKSIFRRIAVRSDQTLDDLHGAIFSAFDRDDEHLYAFYFPPPGTKSLRNIQRNSTEYTSPEMDEGANAAEVLLQALNLKPKQTFYYLFDFGDEWWHEVSVEQVDAPVEAGNYPRVLESKGKSPAQYPDLEDDEDE